MFEGSLIESRRLLYSGTERWTALSSMTLQCAAAGLLLLIPLLHPELLTVQRAAAPLAAPLLPKPAVPPPQTRTAQSSPGAFAAPSTGTPLAAPGHAIDLGVTTAGDAPQPLWDPALRMGSGGSGLPGLGPAGIAQPAVTVAPERRATPVRLSQGVSAGLLLSAIRPEYPAIALAARIQGAVVLQAEITPEGRIAGLRAVSGPPMLRAAALSAVRTARYRPYLLNGQPVAVETTITVLFQLGS